MAEQNNDLLLKNHNLRNILNILIKIGDNHLEIRGKRPIKEMILAIDVA